jgi:nucleoid DNA-binding protein
VVVEKTSLHLFARAHRRKAEGLVEAEVVQSVEVYVSNDDDILLESLPTFGLLEIHNQDVRMQKQIKDRTSEMAQIENQKEEAA